MGTLQRSGKWVQGLLDAMGSFLQLSFTSSRFALADHPREQDRGTLMPVIKSVMKLLCYGLSKRSSFNLPTQDLIPHGGLGSSPASAAHSLWDHEHALPLGVSHRLGDVVSAKLPTPS